MSKIAYLVPAQVSIQGERVLRYISHTPQRAEYEIIGFEDPFIKLRDYRPVGLYAINDLLKTGYKYEFAPKFNSTALVTVFEEETGDFVIELKETHEQYPIHTLWIAIGISDSIPVLQYKFRKIASLQNSLFALVALFQQAVDIMPDQVVEPLSFPVYSR